MNPNAMSLALAGLGGVALTAALLVRLTAKPSAQTTPNVTLPEVPSTAAALDATPEPTAADAANTTDNSITDNAADDPADGDEIEWQDSEDVYRPTPITALDFVRTLGLARPPAILPQQSYIFVKRGALEKIRAHLASNVQVEQGGLIVGQAFVDATLGTTLLVIHDALPAPDGIETPTFFGYTTASWHALAPQLQQMDAEWTLLGSYHSHPDMGVFLSRTDLDTQEGIFSADWQLALVIDPVRDEIGFFVGKDGQPCADWYYLEA